MYIPAEVNGVRASTLNIAMFTIVQLKQKEVLFVNIGIKFGLHSHDLCYIYIYIYIEKGSRFWKQTCKMNYARILYNARLYLVSSSKIMA